MRINNIFGTKFKGAIGKDMIASSWKGKEYVKAYTHPSNPRTEAQQEHRAIFARAVETWHKLELCQREFYNRVAVEMTGYNLFISRYIAAVKNEREPEVPLIVSWKPEDMGQAQGCASSVLLGQRLIFSLMLSDGGGEIALTRSDAPYEFAFRRGGGEDKVRLSADAMIPGGSVILKSGELGIGLVLSVKSP